MTKLLFVLWASIKTGLVLLLAVSIVYDISVNGFAHFFYFFFVGAVGAAVIFLARQIWQGFPRFEHRVSGILAGCRAFGREVVRGITGGR